MLHDSIATFFLGFKGFQSQKTSVQGCEIRILRKDIPSKKRKGTFVLLHGIGASAVHYHFVMLKLANAGYSVIAPDLPSHGLSSEPIGKVNADTYFHIFSEWYQKNIPEDAYLVGNSLGGALSLRMALEHPKKIKKLVLISPAGGFDTQNEWESFKEILFIRTTADSKSWVDRIYHKTPFYLPVVYRPFMESMNRPGLVQLLRATQFENMHFKKEQLAVLPPTLLIWGMSEKIFPIHHLEHLKKILPESAIIERPEQVAHCPQVERPEWLTQRLIQFVS